MREKYKIVLLGFLVLTLIQSHAQKTMVEYGIPVIVNFSSKDYKAHSQNFSVTQDKRGVIYIGNFAGVLEYDGSNWNTIPTQNITRSTAVATSPSGRIYVGAYGEFGFLKPNKVGSMEFVCLSNNEHHEFGEVKNVLIGNEGVYFLTDTVLFFYHDSFQYHIEFENTVVSSFYINGKLYLQESSKGLFSLENKTLKKVKGDEFFEGANYITSMFGIGNDILISTEFGGIYKLNENGIASIESSDDVFLGKSYITCGLPLPNGNLAFGSMHKGLLILDKDFKLLQVIDESQGLQTNQINDLYLDINGNVWLALNNGISRVELSSQITVFNDVYGVKGDVNDVMRFNDQMVVATTKGLGIFNNSSSKIEYLLQITSSCWDIFQYQNDLFAATSEGTFVIDKNFKTQKICNDFSLSVLHSKKEDLLFIGTSNKLKVFEYISDKWVLSQNLELAREEVWNIEEDATGNIWIPTYTEGIYKIGKGLIVENYNGEKGLPKGTGYAVNILNERVMICTSNGVYQYNSGSNSFKQTELVLEDSLNTSAWYSLMKLDHKGNLYVTSGDDKNIALFQFNEGKYIKQSNDLLTLRDQSITTIYLDNNGYIWLGGVDGLFKFNNNENQGIHQNFEILFRKIKINGDSIIYDGAFTDANGIASIKQPTDNKLILDYKNNMIEFEFASTYFQSSSKIQYQYYLEGFDKNWSVWSESFSKEYTNLHPGEYTFYIKALNDLNQVSNIAQYSFEIRPPFYMRWWAISIFIALGGFLIVMVVRLRSRQLIKEKQVLENIVAERTAEVVEQKEEIENKSLELTSKNDELEKINLIVKAINAEINFESLLKSILEKTKLIKGVEKSTALVYDDSSEKYLFKSTIGWDINKLEEIELTFEDTEQRYIRNSKEVYEDIFYKEIIDDNVQNEYLQSIEKAKSTVIIAIKIKDKIEGFIVLENMHRHDAFTQSDFSLMQNLKQHLISAFIKTKILQDLQQTLKNLEETQDQLVQQEKLASLGQLTAGIAHEIQNPLNFVNNFSQLSKDLAEELREILEDEKENITEDGFIDLEEVIGLIEGNVNKINEHGQRASRIVKGMLQHSRGDSGEFVATNVNRMVEEYINLGYHGVRAENKSFNTGIKFNFDDSIGEIKVVPQDLSRVILNMMNNACYAVNEKKEKLGESFAPEISASTKKEGKSIKIIIKDNGMGMPKSVIEKVFNPFFTTKPTGKGTGLGLSMSFDIITQIHKGKLEVNSQDGEFTEFVITIPTNL